MEIETIDDLLKWIYDKSLIATSKCTSDTEQRLIDKAIQYQLLYSSAKYTYKLTDFGFDVVESGMTWANYREYYRPKDLANLLGISTDSMNNYLAVSSMQPVKADVISRNKFKVIESPKVEYGMVNGKFEALPPKPILSKRQKVIKYLQRDDVKTVLQYIVWFAALLTAIKTFYTPIMNWLKN